MKIFYSIKQIKCTHLYLDLASLRTTKVLCGQTKSVKQDCLKYLFCILIDIETVLFWAFNYL